MADESCIHCGQPSEDGDRVTESGRVHERCWDAFSEEKPVAKSSVVAGIFGFSMAAAGATVLSIGLAALAMASALHATDAQNPLVGIPAAILWVMAMIAAYSAIPAGAIMLSIAFFTWVVTNNNAFKNYVAGGAAIVALSVFVVGPTLLSWVNSYEWSRPTNSFEEPNPVKPDGTYTIIDEQQSRSPDSPISGSEEVWVGGTRVGYAEQTYWSNGELRSDNRWDAEKQVVTYFYESGMKSAEHRAEPRGADPQHTGWWGYWYENGQQKYALNLVNAKREGPQVYWYENGQEMLTGNYVGGLPDGPLSEWDANGKETRLCSGNGVTLNGYCAKEGLVTFWHENGQKMTEVNVVNDKREGVFTKWYESGQKEQEGNYVNDKLEGDWDWWHENGQKNAERNYVNDKKEGLATQWHDNGQKKSEGNYVNDKLVGVFTDWYESGQKRTEGNYLNDKPEVAWTAWHENGQKKSEGSYVDDKLEGVWTKWHDNGQKESESNYVNGVKQ